MDKGISFAERKVAGSGNAEIVTANSSRQYRALIGYEGWSAQFDNADDDDNEDDELYEVGVLEEDRDTEHL
jgi:type VI secretion system secreted protein VgrG